MGVSGGRIVQAVVLKTIVGQLVVISVLSNGGYGGVVVAVNGCGWDVAGVLVFELEAVGAVAGSAPELVASSGKKSVDSLEALTANIEPITAPAATMITRRIHTQQGQIGEHL